MDESIVFCIEYTLFHTYNVVNLNTSAKGNDTMENTLERMYANSTLPIGTLCPKRKRKRVDLTLLLMALPFVLFILLFYYSQLFGWAYAFVDYVPGVSIFKQHFTGLKELASLFGPGSKFLLVFKNTLIYGVLSILVSPVPVAFAILLSEARGKRFSRVVQTVTSFPNFISWILVYSVCFMFFNSQGQINMVLSNIGLISEPTNILGDPDAAYLFQTVLGLWKITGWNAIIYLAAIAGIDSELYDAASIDGANRFQRIIHITVQGVKPTFFVMMVLQIGNMMNASFEQFYVFYNPLVSQRLDVIATYVYRVGLGNGQISFATAVGFSQSLISIILLFAVNKLAKHMSGNAII